MILRAAFRGAIAALAVALGFATGMGTSAVATFATETAPARAVLLTVDGKIAGRPAQFDLAALKSLPVTTITTTTPWTDGENVYEGVRLRDLLQRLGGQGQVILADAVDEYRVAIPMSDVEDYDVIIAYAMNGQPLPLNDKGPLWIIYPYSEHYRLQTDVYFSRSVWQLSRLTVQ